MKIEKEKLTDQCVELQDQYHLPYEFGHFMYMCLE